MMIGKTITKIERYTEEGNVDITTKTSETTFSPNDLFSFTIHTNENDENEVIEIIGKNAVSFELEYDIDLHIELSKHFKNRDKCQK